VITVHDWETIRLRCGRNKEPIKLVSRETGIAPNTIRKYLRQAEPPARRPRPRARILDPFVSHVDELIKSTPKITAARIGSYLREHVDAALHVDERTLRKFVAFRRTLLVPKEAFVRALYAPGDQAQFDFSPMSVTVAGVLVVVQLFVMRLSYSGRTFARVSMRCDRPSLFTGLLEACQYFGGTPRSSLFDNASTAVSRILRGASRKENALFAEFRGGLMLDVRFAAPGKGNEKGGVEGIHGYIEDNFFRPTPAFEGLASLNAALLAFCDRDRLRTQAGQTETIGERFAHEAPLLGELPEILPRTCVVEAVRINKFAECNYETNRYSVPTRYAHRDAFLEVYEEKIRVIVGAEVVAEHRRHFGKNGRYLDVRHYLELLARKHRAAETALVLSDAQLPMEIRELLERYRASEGSTATKRWTKVLALLAEASVEELAQVITHAIACGTDDPNAIALLLRQRSSKATAVIDEKRLPEAARITTPTPDLNGYALAALMETAA